MNDPRRWTVTDFLDRVRDAVLAEAVFEIVEPHPLGRRLDVHWADGLVADPDRVLWTGGTAEASA